MARNHLFLFVVFAWENRKPKRQEVLLESGLRKNQNRGEKTKH
jgi:hypothetical protein